MPERTRRRAVAGAAADERSLAAEEVSLMLEGSAKRQIVGLATIAPIHCGAE
jgi:hypothetical protein